MDDDARDASSEPIEVKLIAAASDGYVKVTPEKVERIRKLLVDARLVGEMGKEDKPMIGDMPLEENLRERRPLSLLEWVKECLANCERIAQQRGGADKDGWLEDAQYFREIIRLVGEMGEAGATVGNPTPNLIVAARDLLEACYQADAREELPETIDGSLLDRVRNGLIEAAAHPVKIGGMGEDLRAEFAKECERFHNEGHECRTCGRIADFRLQDEAEAAHPVKVGEMGEHESAALTPERRCAIEVLLSNITPGEWRVDTYKGGTRIVTEPDIPINIFRNEFNSEFIAAAPGIVRELLAAHPVNGLAERLEALEEAAQLAEGYFESTPGRNICMSIAKAIRTLAAQPGENKSR